MIDLKRLLPGGILVVLILGILSCGGQNGSPEQGRQIVEDGNQGAQGESVMLFDTLVHDFGTIIEGERVVCYFDYTNSGKGDLLITAVKATCGCTTPEWSSEPLGPGQKETLEIIFDASGRSGEQRKLVTVKSNASNQVVRLTIRANVNNSV
ncbi:MAG: DUF1573 domain-containing protein [Bacteroidota bacterium]|nr:DUF1573 domain-containing protein [Bacteroidota bacterium]